MMVSPADFEGVAILYNDSQELIKGEAKDLISDQDVVKCAGAVSQALTSQGINARLAPIRDQAEHALAELGPDRFLVFNLAEGLGGRIFEEARIAWLLETSGYCFTGSGGDAIARSTNKALTKSLLARNGLPTPAWWLFHSPEEVAAQATYPFPLIVKPVAEDASLGIGNQAVVSDMAALKNRVAYVLETYRQSALAEEFISGREFNLAAWGDPLELLPLAEIDFSDFTRPEEMIVNYAAKWQDESFEFHHTPAICPADVSPELEKTLSQAALQALELIGARGYARVDFRLDQAERPYILEINCNPDISPGAGFFHTVEKSGANFQEMVLKILTLARRPADDYNSASR